MPQVLGQVEYLIIVLNGSHFLREIVPALLDLLNQGLIRILDLAVVTKDGQGTVTILESGELQRNVAATFVKLEGELSGVRVEDLMMMVALEVEVTVAGAAEGAGESTGDSPARLFAQPWAAGFAAAIRNAEGEVLLNVPIAGHHTGAARQSIVSAAQAL